MTLDEAQPKVVMSAPEPEETQAWRFTVIAKHVKSNDRSMLARPTVVWPDEPRGLVRSGR